MAEILLFTRERAVKALPRAIQGPLDEAGSPVEVSMNVNGSYSVFVPATERDRPNYRGSVAEDSTIVDAMIAAFFPTTNEAEASYA